MIWKRINTISVIVEQVSKRPGRYDEIPKSSTMENRHNLDQQFYATVQRKTPTLTPFSSGGYDVDTIEQLKKETEINKKDTEINKKETEIYKNKTT